MVQEQIDKGRFIQSCALPLSKADVQLYLLHMGESSSKANVQCLYPACQDILCEQRNPNDDLTARRVNIGTAAAVHDSNATIYSTL